MKAHQYSNCFIDRQTFAWQSQNQQRQGNPSGRMILDHKAHKTFLHLFVQTSSHQKARYCGTVSVVQVEGNAPMNVTFNLKKSLPSGIWNNLNNK